MPKDVHLFLLIHGLWGRPFHLAVAQYQLETAWSEGNSMPPQTPPDTLSVADLDLNEETPLLTPPYSPNLNARFKYTRRTVHDDLVVVVAEGMTSQLTYDGVDVCASRVAWEVDQHIAELESEGRRVTRFRVMGYSLGGIVARYLVGLLEARTPSFFDAHRPVSLTTIATPHRGVPRYNTFLSSLVAWFGGRLLSRTGEQIYLVDSYSDADTRPLLEVMADPKHVWHQALVPFSEVHIYANVVNDNTVPYPSAAIDSADHFVQWIERGLEVEADESGIVSDWHFPHPGQARKPRKAKSFHLGTLPPTLRFRWPYNWFILALFPIFFPLIFIFVLGRISLDTRRSRLRLQRLARAASRTAGHPGSPASPTSPASPASPIPSPQGLSIDGLRAAIRAVERSLEQEVMDAADQADTYPSTGCDEPEPDSPTCSEPTIKALLTDRQHRMVHWLMQVTPQRHLAWFPDVANAHAVIVVRDPAKFAVHERGRGVLQHWARMTVLAADKADDVLVAADKVMTVALKN